MKVISLQKKVSDLEDKVVSNLQKYKDPFLLSMPNVSIISIVQF